MFPALVPPPSEPTLGHRKQVKTSWRRRSPSKSKSVGLFRVSQAECCRQLKACVKIKGCVWSILNVVRHLKYQRVVEAERWAGSWLCRASGVYRSIWISLQWGAENHSSRGWGRSREWGVFGEKIMWKIEAGEEEGRTGRELAPVFCLSQKKLIELQAGKKSLRTRWRCCGP